MVRSDGARGWVAGQADAGDAEWERRVRAAGLACPTWPREYGGAGLGRRAALAFAEECHRAGRPLIGTGPGELLVGPVVLAHGTPAQRARLLPPVAAGTERYAVALAEPAHGSDLAGATTRARAAGGRLTVSGHKSLVEGAADATVLCVLCGAAPGGGPALVLVPTGPRVHRADVPLMDGRTVHDVDLDDAPAREVIAHGRGAVAAVAALRSGAGIDRWPPEHVAAAPRVAALVDAARKAGRTADAPVRDALARIHTDLGVLRAGAHRRAGLDPADPCDARLGAVEAVVAGRLAARIGEAALEIAGTAGLSDADAGRAALTAPAATIHPTPAEGLRDLLAEHVLGLPAGRTRTPTDGAR